MGNSEIHWPTEWAIFELPKVFVSKRGQVRTIAMKMFIYCHANKPHFYKKGFGLNLVLEVRVLQTEK